MMSSCNERIKRLNKDEFFQQTKMVNDTSLQGHIEKNVRKIISAYSNDAIVLPPGGIKPIEGMENIRAYYQNSVNGEGRTVEISTSNIRYDVIDENNATELGSYVIRYQPNDTPALTEIKGEMLIVWKRVEGKWKIYLDMWH